jgi:hypothetical protein
MLWGPTEHSTQFCRVIVVTRNPDDCFDSAPGNCFLTSAVRLWHANLSLASQFCVTQFITQLTKHETSKLDSV